MSTRTAHTRTGGLQDGSGQVELRSSKAGTFDVISATQVRGGTTSPEELIAAAHSSCYDAVVD
jgi:osmotically inducible protein OsmC